MLALAKDQKVIKEMVSLLQIQIIGLGNKAIALKKEVEDVENKSRVLMEKKLEFDRLERKAESPKDMTALLKQKNPAGTGAMGVLIVMVIGLAVAFIVETVGTSLGTIEDVEKTLGLQVLGVIPHADPRDVQESLKDKYPEGVDEPSMMRADYLMSHFAPQSMMAESFRALRTNIQFKDADKKIKTIAMTSASRQEGKTLVSINLAIAMAQAGTKILLLDADLRKPMIGRLFGLGVSPGLTDILLGDYPWNGTVRTVTNIIAGKMIPDEVMITPGLDNLHVITSGAIPPNPAELIESDRLGQFIEEAEKEYDLIVFDSPPILFTADAAILGTKADGVLLVYRISTVSRGLLKRSTTQLEQAKCHIMGVILNGMKPETSPDLQDFKYYNCSYSYGEEGERKGNLDHKKGILVMKKRGYLWGSREVNALPGSEGEVPQEEQKKKFNSLTLSLLAVASAFLVGGLLWQYGIIDPSKLLRLEKSVKRDAIKLPVKNTPSKTASVTKPKAISQRPLHKVSLQTPLRDIESLVYQAPKWAKDGEDPEAPENHGPFPSHPYSLQLGSFRTLERAKKAISAYDKRGYSSYWAKVDLEDKGIWFRVFTGYFEDREKAQRFREEHGLKEGNIKKTRYTNLIGTYSKEDGLKDKALSLKDLGYVPYVIRDHNGRSRLFVGASIAKTGAESLRRDLKSQGIQSEVVER